MIVYVRKFQLIQKKKKPKNLSRISEFSKVVGYNINTQKLITYLCTNKENVETELKNVILFPVDPNKIILTKLIQNMYFINYKMLMTENT